MAVDPQDGASVPLFHPRQDDWRDHFVWSVDGLRLLGQTPVGRATIEALEMNHERTINIRAEDMKVRRHPPEVDPRQEIEASDQ
ncbi:MAG: hypothetical protein ETSY1_21850 [Candidatus Entotheonella factor]|uniref:Uncharacterized protein n=1 Tax=Entotheonella factor TaxID=1429438 RepID=W4LIU3_ENTF1|nr:MAG: hypothetical protein ETSY1_21850 [Candidatus Entotheonella factor]